MAADCEPGTSGTSNAVDVDLTMNLAAWGLPAGTLIPVSLASAASHGAVSQLLSLSAAGTITASSPSGSVLVATAPLAGPQTVTNIAPSADATLAAGSRASTPLGALPAAPLHHSTLGSSVVLARANRCCGPKVYDDTTTAVCAPDTSCPALQLPYTAASAAGRSSAALAGALSWKIRPSPRARSKVALTSVHRASSDRRCRHPGRGDVRHG